MKIVFINTLYAPNEIGGAERAVKLMAEMLVAAGHQAVVISLEPTAKSTSTAIINGVKVYYVPLANIYWNHDGRRRNPLQRLVWHTLDAYNPIMAARVRSILKAERPDLIETNNLQGFSVSAWRVAERLRIPVVQVLHDYYLGCSNSSMYRDAVICGKQCVECRILCTPRRQLSRIPVAVSSVSRRTLQRLEAVGLFTHTSIKTINPSALPPGKADSSHRERQETDAIRLGFLGRIVADKGIEVLLRALAEVERGALSLRVGGRVAADYKDVLDKLSEGLDVTFLGLVTPQTFFAEIDVLVVPSLWEEPMPRVIFEAYSFGVPVIVSRLGGMPEAVLDGVTGFVFDVAEQAALPNLLKRIAAIPWPVAAFRAACLEQSKRFEAEVVFAEAMRVWESALSIASTGAM